MLTSHANIDTTFKWGCIGLFALCLLGSIYLEQPIFMAIPIATLIGIVYLIKPNWALLSLVVLIPFSTEVDLSGSLSTDLPTEPLMWLCTGLFGLSFLSKRDYWSLKWYKSPISITLIAMLGWIAITVLFSTLPVYSLKYMLAKIWYVLPFYFFTLFVTKGKNKHIDNLLKLFTISLVISVIYVVLRHGLLGFTFASINRAVRPIYRNHVNYAAILVLGIPYLTYFWHKSKTLSSNILYLGTILFMLFAIYTTYTRAAYVCLPIMIGVALVIRFRLTLIAILASVLVAIGGVGYMIHDSKYLDYAPDFEHTISHKKFENLIEATYKFEDVSTMERVYRWVAGFHMIGERPITGFGPGTFYESYRPYTVSSFETYVSDNNEKSGIHNYFLMIGVEQGIIGVIIFLILTFLPLLLATQIYPLATANDKALILTIAASLAGIDTMLLINDLIESDKVGSMYFINLAIMTILYTRYRQNPQSKIAN